jgi:pilus assembly protein Flp/PilA
MAETVDRLISLAWLSDTVIGAPEAPEENEMKHLISRFFKNDEGQDLVEYAFLVALIALAVIVAVTLLGTNLNIFYNRIATTSPIAS